MIIMRNKSKQGIAMVEPHPALPGKFYIHRYHARGRALCVNVGRDFTQEEIDHITAWAATTDDHRWEQVWKPAMRKLGRGATVQQAFKIEEGK